MWSSLHNSVNTPNTTESCTLSGWIVRPVSYVSTKLFLKRAWGHKKHRNRKQEVQPTAPITKKYTWTLRIPNYRHSLHSRAVWGLRIGYYPLRRPSDPGSFQCFSKPHFIKYCDSRPGSLNVMFSWCKISALVIPSTSTGPGLLTAAQRWDTRGRGGGEGLLPRHQISKPVPRSTIKPMLQLEPILADDTWMSLFLLSNVKTKHTGENLKLENKTKTKRICSAGRFSLESHQEPSDLTVLLGCGLFSLADRSAAPPF